jgi:transcriptional regulator with XRE-family HTH domain
MKQRELAELVGTELRRPTIDGNQVSRWERGEVRPRDETLQAIAKALQTTVADLYAGPVADRPVEDESGEENGSSALGPQLGVEAALIDILEILATKGQAERTAKAAEALERLQQQIAREQRGTQAEPPEEPGSAAG